jgi:hypothetical protein
MKIKTSELIGPALDWAVAVCEGFGSDVYMKNIDIRLNVQGKCSCVLVPINREYVQWSPSTNWLQGGPIIERERFQVVPKRVNSNWYAAYCKGNVNVGLIGPTPLVAAMRCYVASKLGEEVDMPEEML